MPNIGTTQRGRQSGFKWDTRKLNGQTVEAFDEATIMEIKQRLIPFKNMIRERARENAPWDDYGKGDPGRDIHPSIHFPSSQIARYQIFSFITGTRTLTVGLFHDRRTQWTAANSGNVFNYGIALELNLHADTAIIIPTLERYARSFMKACDHAMNNRQGFVADDIDTA
jgi:hypothetical protein